MNEKVRYRGDEAIRRAADDFRNAAELRGHSIPPIDVIYIAEVILKLDVIPINNLFADEHIDAALLPDLSGVYMDEDAYMAWERGVRWVEQRLRFSFAHELGHYVLHKEEIAAHRFSTLSEFKQWAADRSGYSSAEYQADEFAGRFLVPWELLTREYDEKCESVKTGNPQWREIEGMRSFIAGKIAPRFGVNRQVIEVRLDREGIWPAE
jgi:hypothetical protein